MNKHDWKRDILYYEMPWITEYISNPFLQTIIARHTANKVERKMARHKKRTARDEYFKDYKPNKE